MHERNTISFVTLIQGYAQYFELGKVVELFTRLHRKVHELNPFVFATILKLLVGVECAELGCCIHACISKLGHDSNAFVGTVLTNVMLFAVMLRRTFFSWTGMASCYSENDCFNL